MSDRRGTTWTLALLAALWAAGLGLRLAGTDVLLPLRAEPDPYVLDQAWRLVRDGRLDADDPLASKYPQLLARALAPLLPEPLPPAERDALRAEPELAPHLELAGAPHRTGRRLVALLASLLVPATYLLARGLLGRGGALLAAALSALSLMQVVFAQQVRPHAVHAACATLALAALLRARRRDGLAAPALAGLAVGLALATLQSGVFLLPVLPLALLLDTRAWRVRATRAGAALLALLPLPLLMYPRPTASPDAATGYLEIGGLQDGLRDWNGAGFAQLPGELLGWEPALALFALLGFARLVRARRRATRDMRADLTLLLAYVVPTLLVVGLYDDTQERYLLPLLPLLAVAAAHGALGLAEAATRVRLPRAAAAALVVVALLGPSAFAVTRLVALQRGPDTLELAAAWIDAEVPRGDVVALDRGLALPLPADAASIAAHAREPGNTPWHAYQHWLRGWPTARGPRRLPPLTDARGRPPGDAVELRDTLAALDARWVLVATGRPHAPMLRDALALLGERVAHWRPVSGALPDDYKLTFGYQGRRLLPRVLQGVAWGPELELYRVDDARAR